MRVLTLIFLGCLANIGKVIFGIVVETGFARDRACTRTFKRLVGLTTTIRTWFFGSLVLVSLVIRDLCCTCMTAAGVLQGLFVVNGYFKCFIVLNNIFYWL